MNCRPVLRLLGACLTCVVALRSPAAAQCHEELIQGSHPQTSLLGHRMDIRDGLMVVGAPATSVHATLDGAAFVYERQGRSWVEVQILTSGDLFDQQYFGNALTIVNETTIMVQAQRNPPTLIPPIGGSVYVFEKQGGTWVRIQRLFDADNSFWDNFGYSIAVEGDRAAIASAGELHIFERTSGLWSETDVFRPQDLGLPSAAFPGNLVMEGDVLVAGSTGTGDPVIVLEHDGITWQYVQPLHTTPAMELPPLAIQDGVIFVGNMRSANQSGGVYMFERMGATWGAPQLLLPNDPTALTRFGSALELKNGRLAVGAEAHDQNGVSNSGAAYVFEEQGGVWEQVMKATPAQPLAFQHIGKSVELSGSRVYAGGPQPITPALWPGAVHEWVIPSSVGVAYGEVAANSSGSGAILRAEGSPIVDYDCLMLSVEGMPPGQFGYFLMSMSQGFVPLFGGSQGNLHLAFPIVRFSGDILLSDTNGRAMFSPSFSSLPQGTMFQPGETWNFQMWFRDSNPGPTSNTSNGLAITFETTGDPAVQFPATLLSIEEETTQFSIPITLSQATDQDVVIPYTARGTATHGVEWRVEEPNPIVIPAGAASVQMTIVMAEDAVQEGDETGVIELGTPTDGVLGSAPIFTLTIVDDD